MTRPLSPAIEDALDELLSMCFLEGMDTRSDVKDELATSTGTLFRS